MFEQAEFQLPSSEGFGVLKFILHFGLPIGGTCCRRFLKIK